MLIVDAHQDLAWNMLTFGRDYLHSAQETRDRERHTGIPERNGDTLLGWPEFQQGRVALVFASLFATPIRRRVDAWETLFYKNTAEARARYREQIDVYYRLVEDHPGQFQLVKNKMDLESLLSNWDSNDTVQEYPVQEFPAQETPVQETSGQGHPVGLVMLMEGAECVEQPAELEEWWEMGVRMIGPAWAGTRYGGGTREPGPLTTEGYALLDGMADHKFILDLSHMDDQAALQSLDYYPGRIAASHANARALLREAEGNRHLSDRVLQGLIERDGVLGIVPLNSFLKAGWLKGDRREEVTLLHVVAQIDYVCQMAGDAYHVGIGSDFDGGFGLQSVPMEIDTIADLQKLAPLLLEKGYTNGHITAILGGNWISLLRRALPKS
ncbi:MAG TPA: membrane dipeptidase [Anaerolineales bacterium]|nr:membrane dipeptidase [Anaerolineales bacterium]